MNSNSVVQSYEINATLNHTSPKNARNPKISVAHLDKRSKTISRQQQTSFCPHRRAPRRQSFRVFVHRRAPRRQSFLVLSVGELFAGIHFVFCPSANYSPAYISCVCPSANYSPATNLSCVFVHWRMISLAGVNAVGARVLRTLRCSLFLL